MRNDECGMQNYVEEKVVVSQQRYNALIAKEEQLRIIKEMVRGEREGYGDYNVLRSILGITVIESSGCIRRDGNE